MTNPPSNSGPDTGPSLPQAIAHRGYKALHPENTMPAFTSAIAVGAHAIETDLHLSQDGVVVLSHDATLTRCFGRDARIADLDWAELRTLETLRSPKAHMPRLVDLLSLLAQPGHEHVWLLLDVKRDDAAEELLSRVAAAIESVPVPVSMIETGTETGGPSRSWSWSERIVLGCWNESYISLARKVLPGFGVAYIGVSWLYAKRFFGVPGVHFNLLQKSLVGPAGGRFMRAARREGRAVFVWTVNEEEWMEWGVRKGVDGVITDDPKLFLDVCERFRDPGQAGAVRVGKTTTSKRIRLYVEAAVVQVLSVVLSLLLRFPKNKLGEERKPGPGKG